MDFFFTWKDGALELQAHGLGERVALCLIAAGALVAIAWIGAWIYTHTRRSR